MKTIIPLNVGTFESLHKQTCMYRMYSDVTYEAPCIMWYLAGTKNHIVVDLGPPDPEQVLKNHGYVMYRTEKQQPLYALKSAGVEPRDVRIVILTHLHWDHASGFHLFENANFIIQRKELEYAVAPLPCHRTLYHEKHTGRPSFVDYLDRITVINGDFSVEPGVEAISIPSHSPGFQGVSVSTDKGKYFIAGDAVGLFECWETVPHVPSGIFNNLEDYYLSIAKIERIADHVLPGHDIRVFARPSYP
jgi:N-acyl homoserine lactone hydrolase